MFIYKVSTALITGASKGLGRHLTKKGQGGATDMVLVARSKDALQAVRIRLTRQYGVKVLRDPKRISPIPAP